MNPETLPPISQYTHSSGIEVVQVPVILEIPVDLLDGFTAEEAIQVVKDRLADLLLDVSLGGVPVRVIAAIPLKS